MRTKPLFHKAILCAATSLAVAVVGGCGEEAPPYNDLPLRDALSAAPEVLAAMPDGALRGIAERLEEAHDSPSEETAVSDTGLHTPSAMILRADARREEEGKDASVLGAIESGADGFVLRSLAAGSEPPGPFDLLMPTGEPGESTASLEALALDGRAGAILADLARRAEVHEVIRITGAPVGVVAIDGAMYVNASWLVALSALELPGSRALSPPGGPSFLKPPPKKPLSVNANPYNLPATVAACAADVSDVCACATSSSCGHTPTDPTFATAQDECAWVNEEPQNAEALCVLALMRIDGVKECVQAGGAVCSFTSISTRDDARSFTDNVGCMDVLDYCLQHGKPFAPGGSGTSGSGSGSSSSGGSCNDTCDSCNRDTDSCNQNCSDCNQNCSDCNQNCSDCNQNSKSCGKSCRMSEAHRGRARDLDSSPLPVPFASLFWLMVPVGYILRRVRRRP